MSYSIAVAGKGGTGKTTISAILLSELIRSREGHILAVDADANSNFDKVIGANVERTVGSIREDALGSITSLPGGMGKEQYLEYQIQQCLYEGEGYDLISMGRPEGPGCYCFANHIIRRCIDTLSNNYKYIVIDNEAGMEHLSRRTTLNVDSLLLVTDHSLRSIQSAERILHLIRSMKLSVRNSYVVVNRGRGKLSSEGKKIIEGMNTPFLGEIDEDPNITDLDGRGEALTTLPEDSPARQSVRKFCEKIKIP